MKKIATKTIAGREIGPAMPPYIVAELSGNHMGDINRAIRLMDEAKKAGADAVKLQTYTPDTMTIDHDGLGFVLEDTIWRGRTLYDLYQEAQTPWEWHETLFEKGKELEITVFSTPFDCSAVDFLEKFSPPAYKIASFEIVDLPLIRRVAETGRPLIISTGMAGTSEIGEAVDAAREGGCGDLFLLHCVSGYPTPPEDSNLRTLRDLAERFDVMAGLSDHTLGISVALASVALGAAIIEKHVTLKRSDGGPDAAFSLEFHELRELVDGTRTAWRALGEVNYDCKPSEEALMDYRRSLYVVEDMAAGERFSPQNVRSIRPGYGLPPKHLSDVLGQQAKTDIKRGTPLSWDLVG